MTALNAEPILSLRDIEVNFPVATNWLGRPIQYAHALNGISFDLHAGETLGVVGESGCGKTTLAQLLMGLIPPSAGTLAWRGQTTRGANPANVQIVFQDPQSSLDPRLPVWKIIMEPVVVRGDAQAAPLRERVLHIAEHVGLRTEQLERYPHELSGGQRQRVAIARALSSNPDVIVLDEPTSALDISVQAQILNLLQALQGSLSLTYLLISHNISVVRHLCDSVAVMYLGQIVELGESNMVLNHPQHPYTRLLLDSVPRLDEPFMNGSPAVNTELPSNRTLPTGCFFRDRCPRATTGCERLQVLKPVLPDAERFCRCHLIC